MERCLNQSAHIGSTTTSQMQLFLKDLLKGCLAKVDLNYRQSETSHISHLLCYRLHQIPSPFQNSPMCPATSATFCRTSA